MNDEEQLTLAIAQFARDPLGFVLFAFPWGEPGELEHAYPYDWQLEMLESIRDELNYNHETSITDVINQATSSGHGVGKSAIVAWLLIWGMSTCVDCRGVVTANTENQLRTKTWPELAVWHRRAINKHWFHHKATAYFSTDPKHERTWRIDMIPWSEENTEAFAGLHNKFRRIILIFDEASAIADKIWEVSEGALTDEDTEILWAVFGNPTRNSGRFFDCFGRYSHRWESRRVDSRTVPGTNKKQIQRWLEDYGEDSDFFRVRVRGLHPRASDKQFIPTDYVFKAMNTSTPYAGPDDPLIMGIDLARGGRANNVIRYRRGMDARSIPPVRIPGYETRDTSMLISKISDLAMHPDPAMRPDAINVDGTGVGGPLIDRLRQLVSVPINEVQFQWKANDRKYGNFRTEMYAKLRDLIRYGLALDNDADLERQLTSIEYGHNKQDQLVLESKDDLEARIGVSVDDSDALALTAAFSIEKGDRTTQAKTPMANSAQNDYDPLERAEMG